MIHTTIWASGGIFYIICSTESSALGSLTEKVRGFRTCMPNHLAAFRRLLTKFLAVFESLSVWKMIHFSKGMHSTAFLSRKLILALRGISDYRSNWIAGVCSRIPWVVTHSSAMLIYHFRLVGRAWHLFTSWLISRLRSPGEMFVFLASSIIRPLLSFIR